MTPYFPLVRLCLLLIYLFSTTAQMVASTPKNKQDINSQFLAAAKKGDLKRVQAFVGKGAHINVRNQSGNSALYLASSIGNADLVQFLLKRGAKVNQPNRNGQSALDVAINLGHIPVVKLLLNNGANANAKDNTGFTVLMTAVSMEVMARKLAAGGYKPEQGRENTGPDPSMTIIKLLLNKGARVDSGSLEFAEQEPPIKKLLLQRSKSR